MHRTLNVRPLGSSRFCSNSRHSEVKPGATSLRPSRRLCFPPGPRRQGVSCRPDLSPRQSHPKTHINEVPFKSGLEVGQHSGLLEVSGKAERRVVRGHFPLVQGLGQKVLSLTLTNHEASVPQFLYLYNGYDCSTGPTSFTGLVMLLSSRCESPLLNNDTAQHSLTFWVPSMCQHTHNHSHPTHPILQVRY